MSDDSRPSLVSRIIISLPIIGYGARCLAEERHTELVWHGIVLLMAVLLIVLTFGLAGFITIMHALVGLAAVLILSATL